MRDPPQVAHAILALLDAQPGLRAPAIARRLGVHTSTAAYHLARLERRRLVVRERVGPATAYFRMGAGLCRTARRVRARLTPASRSALQLAVRGGLVTPRAIREAGHSRSATRHALALLTRSGALLRVDRGLYAPEPRRRACLRAAIDGARCAACTPAAQRR